MGGTPVIIHFRLGFVHGNKRSIVGYPDFFGNPQMGVPPKRWVYVMDKNPNLKWMMTGGSPMTQETTWGGIKKSMTFPDGERIILMKNTG